MPYSEDPTPNEWAPDFPPGVFDQDPYRDLDAPPVTRSRLRELTAGQPWVAASQVSTGPNRPVHISVRIADEQLQFRGELHRSFPAEAQPQLLTLINAHNREIPLPRAFLQTLQSGRLRVIAEDAVSYVFGATDAQLHAQLDSELRGVRRLLARIDAEFGPGLDVPPADHRPPPASEPEAGAPTPCPPCTLDRVAALLPALAQPPAHLHDVLIFQIATRRFSYRLSEADGLILRCDSTRPQPAGSLLSLQERFNEQNKVMQLPTASFTLDPESKELSVHIVRAIPLGPGLCEQSLRAFLDFVAVSQTAMERLLPIARPVIANRLTELVDTSAWRVQPRVVRFVDGVPPPPKSPAPERVSLRFALNPTALRVQLYFRVEVPRERQLELLDRLDSFNRTHAAPKLSTVPAAGGGFDLLAEHEADYTHGATDAQLRRQLRTDLAACRTALPLLSDFGLRLEPEHIPSMPEFPEDDPDADRPAATILRIAAPWFHGEAPAGLPNEFTHRLESGGYRLRLDPASGQLHIFYQLDPLYPPSLHPEAQQAADAINRVATTVAQTFTVPSPDGTGFFLASRLSMDLSAGASDAQLRGAVEFAYLAEAATEAFASVLPEPPSGPTNPVEPSETPLPLVSIKRILQIFDREGWDPYERPEPNAIRKRWHKHIFTIRVHEKVDNVLEVLGQSAQDLQLDQLAGLQRAIDDWNHERRLPKAYYRVNTERSRIALFASVAVDHEEGVSDLQLYRQLVDGLAACTELFAYFATLSLR